MNHRTFSIHLKLAILCLLAALVPRPALAQDDGEGGGGHAGGAGAEDFGKKMAEISQLMRESERLLLEMTKIEQIVAQQRRVVEQLEKLKTPKQNDPAGGTEQERKQKQEQQQAAEKKQREQLQQKQAELRRKLEDLFKNQDRASSGSVLALEELLRNLPAGGGQGGGSGPPQPQQRGNEKKKKAQEKKQNEKKGKKEKSEQDKQRDGETRDEKREEKEREKESQIDRIEAWIARLPRTQLEAINRNDFSSFPPRYRRLLREYTRRRAKREAEDTRDD